MLELGDYGPDAHAALGDLAGEVGVDVLVAVGPGAARPPTRRAPWASPPSRRPTPTRRVYVTTEVHRGDAVLVKASRAVGLEAVAAALTEAAP